MVISPQARSARILLLRARTSFSGISPHRLVTRHRQAVLSPSPDGTKKRASVKGSWSKPHAHNFLARSLPDLIGHRVA